MKVGTGLDYTMCRHSILDVDIGPIQENYAKTYYTSDYFLKVENYEIGDEKLTEFLNKIRRHD